MKLAKAVFDVDGGVETDNVSSKDGRVGGVSGGVEEME